MPLLDVIQDVLMHGKRWSLALQFKDDHTTVMSWNVQNKGYVNFFSYNESGQVNFHTRLEAGSSKNSDFIYLENSNLFHSYVT